MTALLDSFATMPHWQKVAWVAACLGGAWIAESRIPLVALDYAKWRHARVTLTLLASTMLVGAGSIAATVAVVGWTERHGVGLLRVVDWPVWVELLVAVLLLDLLAQYTAHVVLHQAPWLWPFHVVHHGDEKVDATTGTRIHPGDYLVRECFVLTALVVGGIPLGAYMAYRLLTVFFTYFTHANIALPAALDRALGLLVVTPNMHKFHHHVEAPWTDSNYGNVFSLWDRCFGTLVYDDVRKIRYGLDVLPGGRDEDLRYQFVLPFDPSVRAGRRFSGTGPGESR